MSREEALAEFRAAGALLEDGHFILSSGLRSPTYLQCALALADPARAERLCRALAAKIRADFAARGEDAPALCVSPAMGGVVAGYETARHLGARAIFAERRPAAEGGGFTLRRGFRIEAGERVLVIEDVVTTGGSARECAAAAAAAGGRVVGAAALVDRGGGGADAGAPLTALIDIDAAAYPAEALPPEIAARPAVKPGSRPGAA
ncbi:MAG: orotate phosphoribosyltransferase [Pseudomonadota bacterium]